MNHRERPRLSSRDRLHRVGLVKPDVLVELVLVGQRGVEIVALELRLGPVDDADGTLESGRRELGTHPLA